MQVTPISNPPVDQRDLKSSVENILNATPEDLAAVLRSMQHPAADRIIRDLVLGRQVTGAMMSTKMSTVSTAIRWEGRKRDRLIESVQCLSKMMFVVVIFCSISYGTIRMLANFAQNMTLDSKRKTRFACVLAYQLTLYLISLLMVYFALPRSLKHAMPVSTLFNAIMIVFSSYILLTSGDELFGGGAFWASFCGIQTSMCIILMGDAVIMNRKKEEIKNAPEGVIIQPYTVGRRIRRAVKSGLPMLLVFTVLILYLYGVFPLFRFSKSSAWKSSVCLLALCLKILGNKGQILLMKSGGGYDWKADYSCYIYELATSLMCRILVLSVPNPEAAKLLGIAAAWAEVVTRIFFYVLFIKSGANQQFWTSSHREKFVSNGYLRVMDNNNDMIVEYVSAITAAIILYYLPSTGLFQFANSIESAQIETSTVLTLLLYQIVPELFCDLFCTSLEIIGGLSEFHNKYWKLNQEGRNLERALLLKGVATVTTVALTCSSTMV
mmetsp:Transcript_20208/g.37708  ORF Transcript_20208/g.37708 Transcript_20208/m.37708 type:complete len:495 (-) Transcript_20208:57-1541(-)